ncbi:MAG TPA: transmembrane 220 family protein [Ohtaekwangia sp.]
MIMRVVNFLLAVMFLLFAFLQLNDPDPVIWILIYGGMAVFCIMAMFEYYPKKVIIGVLVIFAGYSILYFDGVTAWLQSENKSELFDEVAKMRTWYVEEAREFLGLLICVLVLVVYWFRSLRYNKSQR